MLKRLAAAAAAAASVMLSQLTMRPAGATCCHACGMKRRHRRYLAATDSHKRRRSSQLSAYLVSGPVRSALPTSRLVSARRFLHALRSVQLRVSACGTYGSWRERSSGVNQDWSTMLISLAALAAAAYHCIRRPSVCVATSISRSHLSNTLC